MPGQSNLPIRFLFCHALQFSQQASYQTVFSYGSVCHQHWEDIRNFQFLAFQNPGRKLFVVGSRRAVELNQLLLRGAEG